jgi:hypothetical protein
VLCCAAVLCCFLFCWCWIGRLVGWSLDFFDSWKVDKEKTKRYDIVQFYGLKTSVGTLDNISTDSICGVVANHQPPHSTQATWHWHLALQTPHSPHTAPSQHAQDPAPPTATNTHSRIHERPVIRVTGHPDYRIVHLGLAFFVPSHLSPISFTRTFTISKTKLRIICTSSRTRSPLESLALPSDRTFWTLLLTGNFIAPLLTSIDSTSSASRTHGLPGLPQRRCETTALIASSSFPCTTLHGVIAAQGYFISIDARTLREPPILVALRFWIVLKRNTHHVRVGN